MRDDRLTPGEPIPAKALVRLAEGGEALSRLASVGGGLIRRGGRISDAGDGCFRARLSGSTSPYSFAEVRDTPGGGWATTAGGLAGTAIAHEYNAGSGLGGKVVTLCPDGRGRYRFRRLRRGPTCKGNVVIKVVGCGGFNFPEAGAAVSFTQGGVTTSATTGADGLATFPVTSTAAATVVVSKARFTTRTLSVSPRCFNAQTIVALFAPSPYVCCNGGCDPVPITLHVTDPNGTWPLVASYQVSGGGNVFPVWTAAYPLSAAGYTFAADQGPYCTGSCSPAYSVTGAVGYVLYCPKNDPYHLANPGAAYPEKGWVLYQVYTSCVALCQSPLGGGSFYSSGAYGGLGHPPAGPVFGAGTPLTPGDISNPHWTGHGQPYLPVSSPGRFYGYGAPVFSPDPTAAAPCIPLALSFTVPPGTGFGITAQYNMVPGTVTVSE